LSERLAGLVKLSYCDWVRLMLALAQEDLNCQEEFQAEGKDCRIDELGGEHKSTAGLVNKCKKPSN
jgi:hypothetical protein